MEETQKNLPKKKKRGVSNVHLWVTAPIAIGCIVLFMYALEWKAGLPVQRIIVDGAKHLQAKEIVALSTIQPKALIDRLNTKEIENALCQHPLIKSAKVSSQLPDAMRISVVEREPFAVVSGKPLLYVDSEAVLLPRLPAMQFDLPLVSGVKGIDSVKLGEEVNQVEIVQAIEVLKIARTIGWYHAISEIKVGATGDIMLFSMDSGVPIFIGRDDVANKLLRLQTFWKNYVKSGTAVQLKYLDLRFEGQVVVKWDRPKDQITRIPL